MTTKRLDNANRVETRSRRLGQWCKQWFFGNSKSFKLPSSSSVELDMIATSSRVRISKRRSWIRTKDLTYIPIAYVPKNTGDISVPGLALVLFVVDGVEVGRCLGFRHSLLPIKLCHWRRTHHQVCFGCQCEQHVPVFPIHGKDHLYDSDRRLWE